MVQMGAIRQCHLQGDSSRIWRPKLPAMLYLLSFPSGVYNGQKSFLALHTILYSLHPHIQTLPIASEHTLAIYNCHSLIQLLILI